MNRTERKEQRRQKREAKYNLVAFNAENDIKYRAPLGINHVRTLAWLCILITQITTLLSIAVTAFQRDFLDINVLNTIQMFADMSLPLFLLASFSYILQNKERCGQIVLFYLAVSAMIPFLFYLVFFHFGAGLLEAFSEHAPENLRDLVSSFAADTLGENLNCNIFIDMLLFSSLTFFLTATPKLKIFSGKKLYIFRALALLPVLYEVGAFVYKLLIIFKKVSPSLYVYVFLPTKAPLTFIAFMLLLAIEIIKKKHYMKLGGTEEGYEEFFATNKNSFLFAKSTAKIFAFIGAIDIIFLLICTLILFMGNVDNINAIEKIGLGKSGDLLLLAPFVLLFSYNRKPKIANYNLILPLAMIFILLLVYLESGYFMITGKF